MNRRSRTFRVFVSSTISDLKAERNALQEHVFPKLRELCERHACQFHAIDLRWGFSQEAALDQQAMTVCLQELKRCPIYRAHIPHYFLAKISIHEASNPP